VAEWEGTFGRTWLVDRDTVGQVQNYVRARLVRARGLPTGHHHPGVYSVERLVADVARFGASRDWFWALVAMGLLAELILNAADGGTSVKKGAASVDRKSKGWRGKQAIEVSARDELLPLLSPVGDLRNAVVHLAAANESSRFVDGLVVWCEANADGAAVAEHLLPALRLAPNKDARKVIVHEMRLGERHADWSRVGSETVALFALRRLNSAGRYLQSLPR
jgi:hypothetical protein